VDDIRPGPDTRPDSTARTLCVIALAAFAGFGVIAALWRQILYADGSWLLLSLVDGTIADIRHAAWQRLTAYLLTQGPTELAVVGNIGGPYVWAVLYGATFHGVALAGLACGWQALSQDRKALFVFPVLSHFGFAMPAILHETEVHVLAAMFWPMLFLALFARSRLSATLLVVLCLLAVAIHEAIVFAAPVLGIALIVGARREGYVLWRILAAGLVAAAVLVAVYAAADTDPVRIANRTNFLLGPLHLVGHVALWFGIIGRGMVLAASWMDDSGTAVRWLQLGAFAFVLLALLSTIKTGATRPDLHYMSRSCLALILPVLGGISTVAAVYPAAPMRRMVGLAATALVVAQTWLGIYALVQWHGYLNVVQNVLEESAGPTDMRKTVLAEVTQGRQKISGFNWDWAWPALSILASPDGEVRAILYDPHATFRPVDPANPDPTGNLRRRGLRFAGTTP